MRQFKLMFAGLALLILMVGTAIAGVKEVPMKVSAEITEAYSATWVNDLAFGSIIADPEGGLIQIDASGVNAATATTGSSVSSLITVESGASKVNGGHKTGVIMVQTSLAGLGVTLEIEDATTTSPATITLSNGAKELTMSTASIIANSNLGAVATANTLLNVMNAAAGDYYLHLGGVLNIPEDIPTGTYNGNMKVKLTF